MAAAAVLWQADVPALGRRFSPRVPVRGIAVYVWVVVALNAAAWLGRIVPAVASAGLVPAFAILAVAALVAIYWFWCAISAACRPGRAAPGSPFSRTRPDLPGLLGRARTGRWPLIAVPVGARSRRR